MILLLIGIFNLSSIIGQTQQFPMNQFMGVNLRREDPIQYLNAVGFVREYRDWTVDEGNFITQTSVPIPLALPDNKYKWNPGFGTATRFDNFYDKMNQTLGNGNICATMKTCLPYLAGGDNFGIFSEFKPIPHAWTGTSTNANATPGNNINFVFTPLSGESTTTPSSYRWVSDWIYQFAVKYGNGNNVTAPIKRFANEPTDKNTDKIKYIELWNEPDKYWIKTYDAAKEANLATDGWLAATRFTGAEYAAMASAVYDANGSSFTVANGTGGSSYSPGVSIADPSMKLVLGGTAGIREYDWKFVKDMKQWFITNRPGVMPFKVINFHHYNSNAWYGLPGNIITEKQEEAASPEEDRWNIGTETNINQFGNRSTDESQILNLTNDNATTKIDPLSTNDRTFKQRLIELKNKVNTEFGNNVEIWMSEFGFDTNEKSPYRAPKLKDNNGTVVLDDRQEVQGRFLVRTFLEIAAASWDRAMQFCIRDEDSGLNSTLFKASGIVKDKANNYAPKKSYYYLSTMKTALNDTKFKEDVLFAGDPTTIGGIYANRSYNFTNKDYPRCYKFVKGSNPQPTVAGDIVYAVWLPTKQNLVKTNFTISVPSGTTQATLVVPQVGDINGVNQILSVNNNSVTIPLVTENPLYIRLGESKTDAFVSAPTINSSIGVSCDAIKLSINTLPNIKYSIYYYEKNDKEENGVIPTFDISDPNLKLFAENITTSDVLVGGLYLGHDKYHILVTATDITTGNISQATRVEAITTSCSNNVLNAVVQTASNTDNELKQALNTENFSLCYPIRDFNALGEWVYFSPNAPLEGYIQFVDAQGNEQSCNLDLVSLLDGTGEGIFQIEYANMNNNYSQGWIEYETTLLYSWAHFPKSVTASRIKIKRLDNSARIVKMVFRGRLVSSPTYSTACCGANEPNLKIISGNTSVSAEINSSNLSSYSNLGDRQIVRIDGNLNIDNYYGFNNNSILYMSPWSKITVKSGQYFDINNTSIQGCDSKWKGITREPNAWINMNSSSIRDAEIALDLQNGQDCNWYTVLFANNSVFEENVTGIQNSYITGSSCNYLGVWGSYFDGNKRDLKPDYTGATFTYNPNQSLDGIILQSSANIWLGSAYDNSNIFQNLANAITSYNSNPSIENCVFRNINTRKVTDPYWGTPQNFGGYGIITSGGKLTLKGLGNIQDVSPLTFDKVRNPIYMYSTNFDIQNCKMTTTIDNVNPGWWSSPYTYGGIYAQYDGLGDNIIKNNTINANGSGISTFWQTNTVLIERNTVDCNQINDDVSTVAGSNIYASSLSYWENAPFAYNIYNIKDNTLIMNPLKRSNGLYLLGVGSGIVENNKVISRDYANVANTDSTFLMNLISTQKTFVNKNSLKGVGGSGIYTPFNVGINLISSPNNSLTCNSIKDARIAISADGYNNTGDSQSDPNIKGIAGNVMEGYNRGLFLNSNSAVTGIHTHRMNRWIGSSDINKAAEFKNNTLAQLQESRFFVSQGTDSEINPTNIPGSVVVNQGLATSWFVPASVFNPFSCSSVGSNLMVASPNEVQTRGNEGEKEFDAIGEHPYVNRKIVENIASIRNNLNIAEASSWIMERDAYNYYKEKLKGNQPNNASLKVFFRKHDNSDIGFLAQLDTEWGNLNETEYKNERKQAKETDKRLGELMQNTRIDFQKLQSIKEAKERQAYLKSVSNDSIAILHGKLITLQKGYIDKVAKKARQLLIINNRLSDTLEYVKFEKEINNIYFNMLANSKTKLTQEDEIRVRTIAMMCPEVAGKAPFKARSVYLMVTTEPLPNWSNCKNSIQIRQLTISNNFGMAIYPNPANDNITISLDAPLSIESYQWQIIDIAGSILKTGKFNNRVQTVNINNINSGIYMVRFIKENALIKTEKFTIIR